MKTAGTVTFCDIIPQVRALACSLGGGRAFGRLPSPEFTLMLCGGTQSGQPHLSSGSGLVEYATAEEAAEAIRLLNNTAMMGDPGASAIGGRPRHNTLLYHSGSTGHILHGTGDCESRFSNPRSRGQVCPRTTVWRWAGRDIWRAWCASLCPLLRREEGKSIGSITRGGVDRSLVFGAHAPSPSLPPPVLACRALGELIYVCRAGGRGGGRGGMRGRGRGRGRGGQTCYQCGGVPSLPNEFPDRVSAQDSERTGIYNTIGHYR
jgi:hypothetical protein